MSGLSREEQAFLDAAYARLQRSHYTFSEKEALREALREGYELRLSFDERFERVAPRQGELPAHWRLAEQTLANARLLHELETGLWDGQQLEEKLLALEQEDQRPYIFYPHDRRMFQNRQGAWELAGERQVTLPLDLKEELDRFTERLLKLWTERATPLTVGQVQELLEDLGWQHVSIASLNRYLRAWLLSIAQLRRVGADYWIPVAQLPPEIQHTRLQVAPVRGIAPVIPQAAQPQEMPEESATNEQQKSQRREQILYKGAITKEQVTWTTTLRSINLLEGFIFIPKEARGVYPARLPGEEHISALRGLWYDSASELWLWLDRSHHRLYGPDLLDQIGLLAAGTRLSIEWTPEQIILREADIDAEVQKAETRLIDLDELKKLRGGIGESYRQSLQALLLSKPEGLTFQEIIQAISQRQGHEVARRTIRSILYSGGFIQRERRWFAAPTSQAGAASLRAALTETLVDAQEDQLQTPLTRNAYLRTRTAAISKRLREITDLLVRE